MTEYEYPSRSLKYARTFQKWRMYGSNKAYVPYGK